MLLILVLLLFGLQANSQLLRDTDSFIQVKNNHRATTLNNVQMSVLANLTNVRHMNEVLDNICIPRVVGTPNHQRVRKYIKSSLRKLDWHIESDQFEDNTPIGRLQFENIIATFNPNANRYLTLVCHHDSKYVESYQFVGATDSAVPCMQLINLAHVMRNYLETIRDNDLSLMFIFLDGEEAFKTWGPTDSIYGARHLAHKWHNKRFSYKNEKNLSKLDKIDLFILLDLIGAKHPTFYNYFPTTSRWYSRLSEIEDSLAEIRQFKAYSYGRPERKYFQNFAVTAGIEDDHIPFLKKHVPILHLIPYPFPNFWHTAGDNRDALSMSTIENINKIVRIFVAEYLNIYV